MKAHATPAEPLEARIAPATFHWDVSGSGNWNDQNNWFNETTGLPDNGFPNAADDVAKFLTANVAGAVVTINGVNITAGSLIFDNGFSYTIAASGGGTLTLSSAATAKVSVSRVNGDAAHTISAPVALASPLLLTQDANSTLTISSSISETAAGLGLTKAGTGPLSLSNPVGTPLPNTFTGALNVQSGLVTFLKSPNTAAVTGPLIVGGAGASASVMVLGTNQIPDTNSVTINALGTVTLNIFEQIGALNINGGTFNLGVNTNTILAVSSLTMTGGSMQMTSGAQSLNLAGNVAVTSDGNGPATITGGQVGLGGATRIFTVNDGPQPADLVVTSLIFNGGMTKNGTGTLRFDGNTANAYTGTTTVNAGTLELAKNGVTAVAGALTIGDGTGGAEADTVRLLAADQIANGVTVTVNSSGLLDLNGQAEQLGTLTVSGGHVTTGSNTAALTVATGLTLNAGRLTAGTAGSVITVPGTVTINTAGQSIIDGLGSLTTSASQLILGVNNSAADIDLLVTIPITGTSSLLKTGVGTLELDAVNTYTGDTIPFGRLIVNGKIGNVLFGSSSTTLAGTGTVGNVTLNGGAIRPGTSAAGVLKTGAIGGGAGDTVFFKIDGATPGAGAGFHDQISVTGAINLTSVSANFTVTATFTAGDQYTLIVNDGSDPVVGTFTGMPEGAVTTLGGRRYIITYQGGDGNDVVLTPEQAFIIQGDLVPGADDYFVIQRDANDANLVHVQNYSAYVNLVKTWDISLTQFANIEIHGGAGDDGIYFDAKNGFFTSKFANVLYALTFIGNEGSNSATLTDLSATIQPSASFSTFGAPGYGAVTYSNGFRARFENLAYLADEIPVTDYTVFGQSGSPDAFTFGAGIGADSHVGITGHLGVDLRSKANLTLNGQGGGDQFDVLLAGIDAPTTLSTTTSDPTGSPIRVFGSSGDDTFALDSSSPTDGALARTGQPTIKYTGAFQFTLEGGAGDDTFSLPGSDFQARIVGGLGNDTVSFASSASSIALNLDPIGQAQTLTASGASLCLGDSFEAIIGSSSADSFVARPGTMVRSIDGGGGIDTLVFDAQGNASTKGAAAITTPGLASLTFAKIETVTLLNVPAKPVLGTPGATFAAPLDFASGKPATALAAADLNGDGRADVVTAKPASNTISILLSTPAGLLLPAIQKSTGGMKPGSIALADLDGDGDIDIAVANTATGTAGILLNDSTGNFAPATTIPLGKQPTVLRAGDLDGDGDIDLAAIVGGNAIAIAKNTGPANFAAATVIPSGSVKARDLALADLDADTDLDLVVLHTGGQLATHANDSTATFSKPTGARVGGGATAIALADFNGDGKLDAAVAHNSVSRFVAILLGKGDTTFAPVLRVAYPLAAKASALVAADFDNDGLADLAIANSAGGRVSILRSLGSGAFTRALDLSLDDIPPRKLAALTLGDLDGDGRPDLIALGGAAGSEVTVLARA